MSGRLDYTHCGTAPSRWTWPTDKDSPQKILRKLDASTLNVLVKILMLKFYKILCSLKVLEICWIFQWLLFSKKSICLRSYFTLWIKVVSSMYQIFQCWNFCILSTQRFNTFHVHAKNTNYFLTRYCLTGLLMEMQCVYREWRHYYYYYYYYY